MATPKTNNESLNIVLQMLDKMLAMQEKNDRTTKTATKEEKVLNSSFQIDASGNPDSIKSAGFLMSSVALTAHSMKGVSKKDVENVTGLVNSIIETINGLKLDKDTAKSFTDIMTGLSQFTAMFEQMNGNFLKNMMQFNPLKGRLLGNRMGNFFEAYFKGLNESGMWEQIGKIDKDMRKAFSALSDTLFRFMQMDAKKLKKIAKTLSELPADAGLNLGKFISSIVSAVMEKDYDKKKLQMGLATMNQVMSEMLRLSVINVLVMKMAGSMLGEKEGTNIGKFFYSIFNEMGKVSNTKLANGAKAIRSITELIGMLTLTVVALVLLAKIADWEDIKEAGAMLVGVVGIALGVMYFLKKIDPKDMKGSVMMAGSFALLLAALSLSLVLTVAIAREYDILEIGGGMLIMLALTGLAYGVIKGLSKIKMTETEHAIATAGAFAILLIAMTLSTMLVMKIAREYDWEELLKGALILGGVLVMTLVFFGIMSLINEKTITKGLIALGGMVLGIIMTTLAIKYYMTLMEEMRDMDGEDIAWSSMIVGLIIAGMTGVLFALGAIWLSPVSHALFAGGFLALAEVSAAILMVTGVVSSFAKLVMTIKNNLTQDDIENVSKMIVGTDKDDKYSMMGCIKDIVNGLLDVGI